MNWFEKLCIFLDSRMQTPTSYGVFHLVSVAVCIIATVLLCVFAKDVKSKTFRWIVFIGWLIMVLFEVYKEVIFMSFHYDGTTIRWSYDWYAFPFQLCSTPLYLLPFVFLLKDGKVRNAIMMFISTFAMFGGLVTFIYPGDVFTTVIGQNLQTMFHHGLQIVLGVYIAVYNRKNFNIKNFLGGCVVFAAMICVAMTLNLVVPQFIPGNTFNMFFISPYFPCTLPLLSVIYANAPYAAFLTVYVLGFVLAALIVFLIIYLIMRASRKKVRA
ncbi:MAG: YwaF family protein [Clostridia bacterium]|nr:YwaF family protein [Clostridia bacterium]